MKKTLLLPLLMIAAMTFMATVACAHTTTNKQDAIEMAAPEEEAT